MATEAVEIHEGDRIYYTGDMANSPAWTKVVGLDNYSAELQRDGDGHIMHVLRMGIGDVYQGHCNPRFVTERAYRERCPIQLSPDGRNSRQRESAIVREDERE